MRAVILLAIAIAPTLGFNQSLMINVPSPAVLTPTERYLNLFIQTDPSTQYSGGEMNDFIARLDAKKLTFKRDKDFLHYLFFKTHRKLLRQYVEYCPFDAIIKDGRYNCLTGTALYAVLLNHFNFNYEVVETNYHIFLIVNTLGGKILFEATDPLDGFVDSEHEIQARITIYKENQIVKSNTEKAYYRYDFNLYNTVSMEQLLGLMYYNLSIDAYNKHDLSKSINYLTQSSKLYQSPRIEQFSRIILMTVGEQDLSKIENEICLEKIQLLRKKMPGLTSAN